MNSTGLLLKDDQMIIVSLNQGLRETYLEGYEILQLVGVKGEARDEAILFNLDRFFKVQRGAQDNLFIALPRDKVLVQYVYLPLAVEENLRTALSYEIDRLTPFSLDTVYFDYHIVKRLSAKKLIHIMLITVKREIVDYYLNLLKRINIRPRGIEITSTALFNIFKREHNGSETLLTTDWIFNNPLVNRLQGAFPKLFPQKFNMPSAEATPTASFFDILIAYLNGHYELNIINEGNLYYSRSIPLQDADPVLSQEQNLKHHLKNIQSEVQRGILTIPGYRDKEGTVRCFLAGRELDAESIQPYSELSTLVFSTLQDVPVTLDEKTERAKVPLLSIAIGLALKGVKRVPLDINLIPLALRPKKKRSKKKIGALFLLSVFMVLLGAVTVKNIVQRRAYIAELDKQLTELKVQAKTVEATQEEINQIEKYNTAIKQIKDQDVSKLKILAELTRIIPNDSWLTDFEYTAEDKKITLTGYSTAASQLIQLLEDSPLFENVKFTSPITKGTDVKENFKIEMKQEQPKASARKPEATKK